MTIQGYEPTISALRTQLAALLPGKIATINAAATDGITIADPVQVYDHLPSLGELTDWPIVAIEEGRLSWEDDTGHHATGVLDLLVVAYIQHSEPSALAVYRRRYALAIMRASLEGATPRQCTPAWGITCRGVEPGPSATNKWRDDEPPGTYATFTAVGLRLKYDES